MRTTTEMTRPVDDTTRSSNYRSPSPFTIPLFLVIAPATLVALGLWPLLVLGSFVPVVGLFSLTSLLSVTIFLYLAIPTTAHLLFSQSHAPPSHSTSFLRSTMTLPRLPLFTPTLLAPIQLTHSILRLSYDAYRASVVSLFLDSISKRILILGGADSARILKENIVYSSSGHPPNVIVHHRLDVYYPERAPEGRNMEARGAPVILLLASPTYRFLGMRSFPGSQIALRLRRLGYCVVVPSLTSFPAPPSPHLSGRRGSQRGSDDDDVPAIEVLVAQVRASLGWIADNVEQFGGDAENVWILGQGVGANVALLTVVQSAVVVAREVELEKRRDRDAWRKSQEARVGRDSTDVGDSDGVSLGEESDGDGERAFEPCLAPSGVDQPWQTARAIAEGRGRHSHHGRNLDGDDSADALSCSDEQDHDSFSPTSTVPLPAGVNACRIFDGGGDEAKGREPHGMAISRSEGSKVRGMILIGGAYDNLKQMKREQALGLEQVSALQRVLGPTSSDAELTSPSHLLYGASSLLSSDLSNLPAKFLLIHGGADWLVPYSQSVLLKNLLVGVGIASEHVKLRLYREETGLGSLTSLMHQTRYSPLILDEIERIISADLNDKIDEESRKDPRSHSKRTRQKLSSM